jgi:quercetin dioxygenase-like cupin family protein
VILDDGRNVRLELVRTKGEVLEMRATYRAGSQAPPRHYHPQQEETFIVHTGQLWFEVNGEARVVSAGESIVVPPRAVHRAKNASKTEEATCTWETRPALRSAQFFEATYTMNRKGFSLLTMSAIAREFRDEFQVAGPRPWATNCLFALLSPVARVVGKGPRYTE